jgi:hypothetical protein
MSRLADDPDVIRIGNCSGFYGDRLSAMREMLEGGPLDVLTGDYLAELTMLILGRDRMKDPGLGYAKTFVKQIEECLGLALERNVQIVTNAGGLNPAGLAEKLRKVAAELGLEAKIAHVEGDDLSGRAAELELGSPLTANAYLGAWGIVECLNSGADIVVTGRVTDASVIVGPAAAHFGWDRTDYDRLAGAVVAGHVIECSTQATGGNYAFFTELEDLGRPGFPIAEIRRDGSSVITKHPGTGGAVTVETVQAQLMYEIQGARYAGPDVTTRLDTIRIEPEGADRVRISGVTGEAPPPQLKVSLNTLGGFRNEMEFVLTGLDIEAKAELAQRQLESWLSVRPAALRGARSGSEQGGPGLLQRRGGTRAGQLPGVQLHHAAGQWLAIRGVHAGLRRCERGAARGGARRRHPRRYRAGRRHPRARAGSHPGASGTTAERRHSARPAGRHRLGPQRRQGRRREYRRLGAHR